MTVYYELFEDQPLLKTLLYDQFWVLQWVKIRQNRDGSGEPAITLSMN